MLWGVSGANFSSVYDREKIARLQIGVAKVLAKLLGKPWRRKLELVSSMYEFHVSCHWALTWADVLSEACIRKHRTKTFSFRGSFPVMSTGVGFLV